MSEIIQLTVNGKLHDFSGDPKSRLLAFLRDELGLMGTKNGCGTGHCGACTVIIDGSAKPSCVVTMDYCSGRSVETIESLDDVKNSTSLHPIQQAFVDEGAVQCGFCTPGMVMAVKVLLDEKAHPTEDEIRHALRNNICRCTGYGAILRAVKRADMLIHGKVEGEDIGAGYIGASVPRKDAPAKVTGQPVFADDLVREGALHGRILFSAHAHAKIKKVDVSRAEAMDGVIKVAVAADVHGLNKFGLFVPQQPVLCADEVKYFGDVVACVYAENPKIADEALAFIDVEYDVLPALLDAEENIKEGALKVHEDSSNNIIHHVSVRKGDVDKAFEEADVIVEHEYETQAVEHAYLEPESCLCEMDGDVLTIHSGSQGSVAYQQMVCQSLDIPLDKVRVVFTATGGGFGGKEEPTVQILAALGTQLTGRPVKMVLSRAESLRMSTKRHPMKIRMKHGATKDGRIVAMSSHVIGDSGAYISQTNPVIFRSAVTASGPYHVENVHADSYGVYTHKNPSGAFRGFGSTQASFACESQMDEIAIKIGMSPYELRSKNGFCAGSVTSTGQVLKDGIGYLGTLDAAQNGLEKMRTEFEDKERPSHIKLGFGIASAYKNVGIGTGLADKAGAYIELLEDGRIQVSMGATDMGQGVDTICAQIAAETFGAPYELVDVRACDTGTCPDGGMTTASRQTYVTGNAVKEAAALLRRELSTLIKRDRLSRDDLVELYKQALQSGKKTRIEHDYYPPQTYKHKTDANHKEGEDLSTYDIHYSYCFASASVALEVDTESGDVNVLKVCAAQDVGKALHPKNVIGQIEGAVAMGIGMALTEEYLVDDQKVYTDTYRKLGILSSEDMPEIEAVYIEEEQLQGPYGAKGMGEVGLNPIAPAIANAISDACGIRLTSLPMKKEKILKALNAEA